MKLKVCGMKQNTQEIAELQPDYLGFIFWEPSKRFFDKEIPSLPIAIGTFGIKKIGVFVDAAVEDILEKVEKYDLWGVQLHGRENPEFCDTVRANVRSSRAESREKEIVMENRLSTSFDLIDIKIIKVFSIKDDFDFSVLEPYEKVCDYYLFDTKGKLPGGNGFIFDWEVLKDYPSRKPYFLSGGIGLDETESIKEFLKKPESKYCHAIDVNSRFEIEPGLKNVEDLKKFKEVLGN